MPELLNPHQLPLALLLYAAGQTHHYPNTVGIERYTVRLMNQQRKEFLRQTLRTDPTLAYTFPDFHRQMDTEIYSYIAREIRPQAMKNWDTVIGQTKHLIEFYFRERDWLEEEYRQKVGLGKATTKAHYRELTAKRRTLARVISSPQLLGELELAMYGSLRYGLPP